MEARRPIAVSGPEEPDPSDAAGWGDRATPLAVEPEPAFCKTGRSARRRNGEDVRSERGAVTQDTPAVAGNRGEMEFVHKEKVESFLHKGKVVGFVGTVCLEALTTGRPEDGSRRASGTAGGSTDKSSGGLGDQARWDLLDTAGWVSQPAARRDEGRGDGLGCRGIDVAEKT
jgi:hypothetical protein